MRAPVQYSTRQWTDQKAMLHCARNKQCARQSGMSRVSGGSTAMRTVSTNATAAKSPVWLVTGAGRGLGKELVKQLAHSDQAGTIIATARKPEALDLSAYPQGKVHALKLDTSDPSSIQAAAKWIADNVGRLDVLLNNAAAVEHKLESWDKTDPKAGLNILTTNVLGPLLLSAALVPLMKSSGGERKIIANFSSQAGSLGSVAASTKAVVAQAAKEGKGRASMPAGFAAVGGAYAVYRASKAALNMETLVMARDLTADGFIVVSLHPGFVATDLGNASASDVNSLNEGTGAQKVVPMSVQDSAAGLLSVLQKLTPGDSGSFIGWDGKHVDW